MKPKHIAIIPDGNRRWAKRRGLTPVQGHDAGIDNIQNVLKWCRKYGIRELTMWGFSTENFLRDRSEVTGLISLFKKKLSEGLQKDYKKYKVRVRFLGKISSFPRDVQEKMREVEEETKHFSKYSLNLMLAYGGRQEILEAVNKAIKQGMKKVDEKSFASLLSLKDSPDLVIRTSGEVRTSGFLPWQSAYSEFYFSRKLWPDFHESDFRKALADYAKRKRKYGK